MITAFVNTHACTVLCVYHHRMKKEIAQRHLLLTHQRYQGSSLLGGQGIDCFHAMSTQAYVIDVSNTQKADNHLELVDKGYAGGKLCEHAHHQAKHNPSPIADFVLLGPAKDPVEGRGWL